MASNYPSNVFGPKRVLAGLLVVLGIGLIAPAGAIGSSESAAKASASAKAQVSKKKCKAKRGKCKKARKLPQAAPVPAPPAAPSPLPLTYAEAYNRADYRAYYEYLIDPYAIDWGVDGCVAASTYQYNCYVYNIEYYGPGDYESCDWLEIVQRSGYSGVTSFRSGDFYCYPI